MKIYRIAQADSKFEDEGHDMEERVEEREQFEAAKEMDDALVGRRGMTHTAQMVNEISSVAGESIESSYVTSGTVGWFKYKDGIIYEVLVSPAAYGQYYNYFKDLMNRKVLQKKRPRTI